MISDFCASALPRFFFFLHFDFWIFDFNLSPFSPHSLRGYSAYSPSKFAVRALADALHMELLPWAIGVSILFPPNTATEGFEEELRTMPAQVQHSKSRSPNPHLFQNPKYYAGTQKKPKSMQVRGVDFFLLKIYDILKLVLAVFGSSKIK